MKRTWFIVAVVLLLIGGLILNGCAPAEQGKTQSGDGAGIGTGAEEKTEIIIGAISSQTGVEAASGVEQSFGYKQAVDDINAAGGVYVEELGKSLPIKLIMADDESDPSKAATIVERFIKHDNADFILGSVSGLVNTAPASVADKYKVFMIATTFWPELFLEQNLEWVACSFFTAESACEGSIGALSTLPEDQRLQIFSVFTEDNPDGHAFGESLVGMVEEKGYTVATYETFTPGQKDFSASILNMKSKGVEAVLGLIGTADAITLTRQMKEQNFAPKYFYCARGTWPQEYYEILGPDSDYLLGDGQWLAELGGPGSEELSAAYQAKYNRESVSIGNFYSIVQALAQAIEEAGSLDSRKVRDLFYSGEFVAEDTTMGNLHFNERGLATWDAVYFQWYEGKRYPVWPHVPEIWTLKLMPPWDER